jgi:hypothetical protein
MSVPDIKYSNLESKFNPLIIQIKRYVINKFVYIFVQFYMF